MHVPAACVKYGHEFLLTKWFAVDPAPSVCILTSSILRTYVNRAQLQSGRWFGAC